MQEALKEIQRMTGTLQPVKPKNLVALRSIIKMVYPNMNVHDRASFTNLAASHLGAAINARIPDSVTSSSQMVAAIQELAYDGESNKFRESLDQLMTTFKRDSSIANEDQGSKGQQGKQTLRSRFTLPGPEDFLETPQQQLADAVQSDLFTFVPRGDGGGANNMIFLRNQQAQAMRWQSPTKPRPTLQSELFLPFQMPWQYNEQPYMQEILEDQVMDQFAAIVADHLPPSISLLGDVQPKTDPNPNPRVSANPYISVIQVPPKMGLNIADPLPIGYDNYLKFKPELDPWRRPLAPSNSSNFPQSTGKILSSEQQLADWYANGPQIYY